MREREREEKLKERPRSLHSPVLSTLPFFQSCRVFESVGFDQRERERQRFGSSSSLKSVTFLEDEKQKEKFSKENNEFNTLLSFFSCSLPNVHPLSLRQPMSGHPTTFAVTKLFRDCLRLADYVASTQVGHGACWLVTRKKRESWNRFFFQWLAGGGKTSRRRLMMRRVEVVDASLFELRRVPIAIKEVALWLWMRSHGSSRHGRPSATRDSEKSILTPPNEMLMPGPATASPSLNSTPTDIKKKLLSGRQPRPAPQDRPPPVQEERLAERRRSHRGREGDRRARAQQLYVPGGAAYGQGPDCFQRRIRRL